MNLENSMDAYYGMIRDIPILTAEEEKELSLRVKAGDKEAFDKFVNANLKLVVSIAKDFRWSNVPLIDLVQEGNIGLINAVRKFDASLGFRFSTYGTRLITQQICRKLSDYDGMIRIPEEKRTELYHFKKVITDLTGKLDREPTEEEIAEIIGKDIDYVKEQQAILNLVIPQSLDKPVGDDNETTIGDLIAGEGKQEETEKEQIVELVGKISNDVVKKAIVYFFEAKVEDETNIKEVFANIGERLHITAERARQIITSYLEYQKNHENTKYIENGLAETFASAQLPTKSGIGTAHTTDKFGQVRAWAEVSNDNTFMKNWDSFYRTKDTVELVKRIECTDFYVYFVRYVLDRFSEMLPAMAAEEVYEEILGKKETPLLDQLVACVESELVRNQSNLRNIREIMTSERISEKEFFQLAVGLHMDIEDAEEFLQKVLLRERLDPFKKEEAILYIALKYVEGNKQKFIDKAVKVYDAAPAKQLFAVQEDFNTIIYKSKIEQLLEYIDGQLVVFDDDDEVMEKLEALFSHMKYLAKESDYQRTADRIFLQLYEEFRALTKEDRDKFIEPAQEKTKGGANAEGEVEIQYDCRASLSIPEGHTFIREKDGKKTCYELLEAVIIPATSEFEVLVPVQCVEETDLQPASKKYLEIGYAEKGTEFESDISYVKHARNKSMFKLNKSDGVRGKIKGNIILTCDANECELQDTVLPAGTIFKANGIEYVVMEDIKIVPTIFVTVRGDKEAKIHEIQKIEKSESYPQIFKIDNTKISYKKDSSVKKEDKTKSKLTHKLSGELDKYLYLGAGGDNIYKLSLEKADKNGKMREKLLRILKDTDIDFANRTRAIMKAKNNQKVVTREELLTMAFLTEMAREQFSPVKAEILDAEERLASRMQRVNFIMNSCGFYGIYPVNPYDAMMLYISTFEREPIYVYRNLWGNLQDYVAKK